MNNFGAKLIIAILTFISEANATGANPTEPEELVFVGTSHKELEGPRYITYGSKEELTRYLTLSTPGKEWEAIQPYAGQNIFDILRENPELILKIHKKYGCVQESAPEFWEGILEEFPGKTFTLAEVERVLGQIEKRIVLSHYATSDLSISLTNIAMETSFKKHQFMRLLMLF